MKKGLEVKGTLSCLKTRCLPNRPWVKQRVSQHLWQNHFILIATQGRLGYDLHFSKETEVQKGAVTYLKAYSFRAGIGTQVRLQGPLRDSCCCPLESGCSLPGLKQRPRLHQAGLLLLNSPLVIPALPWLLAVVPSPSTLGSSFCTYSLFLGPAICHVQKAEMQLSFKWLILATDPSQNQPRSCSCAN